MIAGLAMELIGGDVEVAVGCDGEGVGPEEAWIVGDRLPEPVGTSSKNGIVLVVRRVDVAIGIGLETIRGPSPVALMDDRGDQRPHHESVDQASTATL